jgi:hypothetical protein
MKRFFEWLRRLPVYFAVLRPSFFIALIIVYLPLTASCDKIWGNSMLANLFVEYDFSKAFWFAFPLFGAVWALMLTTCLLLDFARDRQSQGIAEPPWVPDPGKENRWVTIPLRRKFVFWLFTLPSAPAAVIVIWRASNEPFAFGFGPRVCALLGLAAGGLLSYLLMQAVAAFVRAQDHRYQVLPCRPGAPIVKYFKRSRRTRGILNRLGRCARRRAKCLRRCLSIVSSKLPLPDAIFEPATGGIRFLKSDHFFAAVSAISVILMYTIIYWFFKPIGKVDLFLDRSLPEWMRSLDSLPPAAFIYALIFPLIWIISALWAWLGRYRLALYLVVFVSFVFYWCASSSPLATRLGNPVHTYDVAPMKSSDALEPRAILAPRVILAELGKKERENLIVAASGGSILAAGWTILPQNLIIVAASGGGILAAGWTAQVLTKLHAAYPDFARELRLISSVSGGSVGAAHYVNSVSEISRLSKAEQEAALKEIAEDAMTSSLAATAYGVAFPDFRRAIFPFGVDEEFDRARLLETDWHRIASCRKEALKRSGAPFDFHRCRKTPENKQKERVWFSQWRRDIEAGLKPAVIFNTTVMETGERVAITPLSSLQSGSAGTSVGPRRRGQAETLAEFLSGERHTALEADPSQKADETKADQKQLKTPTCPDPPYKNGYDIDVWTAARLSATFSYVSPAARAACLDYKSDKRNPSQEKSPGRLHLIDGGYHDNYGVASALDWLSAVVEAYGKNGVPVSRIALVEIRAQPDIPIEEVQNEWSSAWFGPFWGLFNSWGYAQTSSNSAAVSQHMARFRDGLAKSDKGVEFRSFVFAPKEPGPLSWHLSEDQKEEVRKSWASGTNPDVCKALLKFLNGEPAQC